MDRLQERENSNVGGASLRYNQQQQPNFEENKDLNINLGQLSNDDTVNKNWFEIRLLGKVPERRGYHSTFVSHKK